MRAVEGIVAAALDMLPLGWQRVRLGELLRQRKEFLQIDDLGVYKRCRVQLHAQGIVLRDIVAGSEVKTKSQQVCRSREFLVAEIDAKVGGFGIVPDALEGAIVSSHYFLFVVNEKRLDRRFLDWYVRTPQFQEQVSAQGSTNYAAIRPSDVLSYTIPLPSLDEQRRIVARIEALAARVAEARELRREAVVLADALIRSAMLDIFGTDQERHTTTLEAACAAIIDNLHSNPFYADSGVPCVRSPDVGWGTLDLAHALVTSEDEYRRRTVRGEPKPGDIVLVREGGGTGKAALVEEGQRFSLGQRVMMIRPNCHVIMPKYFLYQLLSPAIYDEQIAPMSKGSASPHLNIGALRKFRFQLPHMDEQKQVVAHLDELFAWKRELEHHQAEVAAKLDALLPAVLDRAFRGEI